MKVRMLLAAVVVAVGMGATTPASAWIVKCSKDFREAMDENGPSAYEVRRYANCMI